jgi:prepilin-type N-terminal cleavage/methylation domain-containing protein
MNNSRGFTLMETLLAAALFAIVMVSSFGVFRMGIVIWKRSQGAGQVERKAVLALEKMAQDIRAVTFMAPDGEKDQFKIEDMEIEYSGSSKRFALPGFVPVQTKDGVLIQFGAIGYRWDSRKKEICRTVFSATQAYRREEPENAACVPVAAGIERVSFEYWIYNRIGRSYSWYDDWDPDEGLPHAVRITLEIPAVARAAQKKKYVKTVLIPTAAVPEETPVESPDTGGPGAE